MLLVLLLLLNAVDIVFGCNWLLLLLAVGCVGGGVSAAVAAVVVVFVAVADVADVADVFLLQQFRHLWASVAVAVGAVDDVVVDGVDDGVVVVVAGDVVVDGVVDGVAGGAVNGGAAGAVDIAVTVVVGGVFCFSRLGFWYSCFCRCRQCSCRYRCW